MHYFLSAGEASGDLHASRLIDAIKRLDKEAEFTFLGGDEMSHSSGCEPVIHYRDMAYMGFIEVIKHLKQVLGNLDKAKESITATKPDALILVDYPSFNLRLAHHAKSLGIPVYYYISPKVWAWKEGRVKKLRKYINRILSILPFEPQWFQSRHGMKVDYVGNPSLNEVDARIPDIPSLETFRRKYLPVNPLDNRPLLALVPGSRKAEILSNLPVMIEVARRHPDLQPVIAAAPGLDPSVYEPWKDIPTVSGVTFELMGVAKAALVTSGTATLEAALLATPQVVCYRNNGSRLAYSLFKRILKIKYVSLPNLITDSPIVAEQLLHHCNPEEVDNQLTPLLDATEQRRAQQEGYLKMRELLTQADAALSAAEIICNELKTSSKNR